MKILITGANGMLAKEVINIFANEELILTDVDTLDITNEQAVLEFVKQSNPEYIINCAAYTAVDKAEEDIDLCTKVNVDGPRNLAKAAESIYATLLHISTDYVFDGEKYLTEIYKEDDITNPQSVYGATKRDSENEVINNCSKHYILRTSWLFGNGNNFVRTMLKLGKEKTSLNVVNDQHGSPTYAVDLSDIIKQVIEKKIPYGIYHANNLGFTTWYDFTKEIFEIAKIDCKVNPCSTEEFPRPAKRPKNSKLAKDKILHAGIEISDYKDALKRYLEREQL